MAAIVLYKNDIPTSKLYGLGTDGAAVVTMHLRLIHCDGTQIPPKNLT